MEQRILCLFFPGLAVDRLGREDPARRLRPVAVTQEEKGCVRIAAVNTHASKAGIVPGTRLADAKAVLPTLEVVPDDPAADGQVKQRLIDWCNRYSPLVADDRFGGIALDITGCAHLFRGEVALLDDIEKRIRSTGYRVRGAIAPTIGAAWGLARYSKQAVIANDDLAAALQPLPVEMLRLPEELTQGLRRAGLATIAALQKVSNRSLTVRYGRQVLLRLHQALGQAEEPIIPYRAPTIYRAGRKLAEPIGTVSAVEHVLLHLLREICARLVKDHRGARKLSLHCYRVDGTVLNCEVDTSRPVRSVTHLMRLFSEKLGDLDAGFGFEMLVLVAPITEAFDPVQMTLAQIDEDAEDESVLNQFLDRVGTRLGFDEVCGIRVRDSLLPEHAVEFQPVTVAVTTNTAWPENRVRPLRMVRPPMRIEVWTLHPGGRPARFQVGSKVHRIVRAEGPERLTPEWWREEAPAWQMRDYYRIENDRGERFWIFAEVQATTDQPEKTSWFLSGHLP